MPAIKKRNGFTLIELCIVLIISGLLLTAGLQAFNTYLRQQQVSETKGNIAAVQAALNDYVQANGHYPCPAPIDAAPDTAEYGASANCAAAAGSGITEVVGRGGRKVRIGAIPVRTLGLSESYLTDGWSRRYTYAVTQKLTVSTPGTFSNAEGGITIKDASGNTVANGTAHYVLVSHGPDGKGAYASEGGLFMLCSAEPGQDQTNCDKASATFIVTANRATAAGNGHYDDFAAYGISVAVSDWQKFLVCSAKKKFYAPADPKADADGCAGAGGGGGGTSGGVVCGMLANEGVYGCSYGGSISGGVVGGGTVITRAPGP
jgi:prepilin-type N-terminal cleavage/methylation domain-containing protein